MTQRQCFSVLITVLSVIKSSYTIKERPLAVCLLLMVFNDADLQIVARVRIAVNK